MKRLTPEIITRLENVKAAILAEPQHFDLGSWFAHRGCGTTACIAGHLVSQHRQETLLQTAQTISPNFGAPGCCFLYSGELNFHEEMLYISECAARLIGVDFRSGGGMAMSDRLFHRAF